MILFAFNTFIPVKGQRTSETSFLYIALLIGFSITNDQIDNVCSHLLGKEKTQEETKNDVICLSFVVFLVAWQPSCII